MNAKTKRILPDNVIELASTPEFNHDETYRQLLEIIEQRQLTPHFQPIISMSTGEIFAYEGLIRGHLIVCCIHH